MVFKILSSLVSAVMCLLCLNSIEARNPTLFIPNHPLFNKILIHMEQFKATSGLNITIAKSIDLNSVAEEVRVDLGVSTEGLGAYDAYCIKTTWVPELADKDLVQELDQYIKQSATIKWADILPFARNTLSSFGSNIFVLPNDADFFFMAYRRDVFAAVGISSPSTWEDFVEAARKLNGTDM